MTAIAHQAPVYTLAAFTTHTLDVIGTFYAASLLCDGRFYRGCNQNGSVHLHVRADGIVKLFIPTDHLLTLDLSGVTHNDLMALIDSEGKRYRIRFPSYRAALAFLALNYGVTDAPSDPSTTDCAPAPADASPRSSVIVVPAHLSTPTRLTPRPLSTTAFSPFGVIHMSKKQPIRVFLDPETHSRHLIQAGTNGLTSSALSERLIEYGLAQLERGEKAPLEALARAASPAPHGSEA
ncbi:hypothetical protein ACQKE4_09730 [Halomonas sp. NPDC076908]|uniref:hypothetical protein n=1 Tax=Halomonas sp. NPDC076908 TaxID=3390567 RepID=UPI003D05E0A0